MGELGSRVTVKPHMLRWNLDGTITFSSGGTYTVHASTLREVKDAILRRRLAELAELEGLQRDLRREELRRSRRKRRDLRDPPSQRA